MIGITILRLMGWFFNTIIDVNYWHRALIHLYTRPTLASPILNLSPLIVLEVGSQRVILFAHVNSKEVDLNPWPRLACLHCLRILSLC